MTIAYDMDHAKACAQTVLAMKLKCWEELPLKLCGVAARDPLVAQRTAKQCSSLFDATPPELQCLHHPLACLFLEHEGPGRELTEQFAQGTPLSELPASYADLVASFQFIPIAERVVEAQHKDAKRMISRLTRHRGARVSMAIRSSEIASAMHNSFPGSRDLFCQFLRVTSHASQCVSELGFATHPEMEGHRGHALSRVAETVVYRCDTQSQYFDLTHAYGFNEAEKRRETKRAEKVHARSKASSKKESTTWNDVVVHALLDYLRWGAPCHGNGDHFAAATQRHVFSVALGDTSSSRSLEWRPLEVIAGGHTSTQCVASLPGPAVSQVALSEHADQAESQASRSEHVFFLLWLARIT